MSGIMSFFAPAPLNMEDLLEKEITSFGGKIDRVHRTGIAFSGTLETAYRMCLWSRTASRVLVPILETECGDPEDLYRKCLPFPWNEHIRKGSDFVIDSSVKGPEFTDSRYASMKLKDAIADSFRKLTGTRPSVSTTNPDIRINLNIRNNTAVVSVDLAGEGLHKRGYRTATGPAPLKENTAAAVLMRAGWQETAAEGGPLVDPMCGSGTLLIEGAMIAGDIAPGLYHQSFGFHGWMGHDSELWKKLYREAETRRKNGEERIPPIRGFDKDPGVISAAWENIKNCGLEKWIHVEKQDLADLKATAAMDKPGLMAVNPPYGKRLEEIDLLSPLYRLMGDKLKENFPGWKAVIITSVPELAAQVGIKPDKSNILYNGPLECRVNTYTIFSRKERSEFSQKERTLSPGAEMFSNRLKKNLKTRKKWAAKNGITSYRLYDADMPEYSAAVDFYENTWAYVQEYAPPKGKVDPEKARRHRKEMLQALPYALEIPGRDIFFRTRERKKGADQYKRLGEKGEKMIIREGGYRFLANFTDYLDTGIFLDHRKTRAMLREMAAGKTFLNLFAYTGTASVYAAGGGADRTLTVDASRNYLQWAEKNMEINGFLKTPEDRKKHSFLREDCISWLSAAGEKFDLIFLDPPTFSNSKSRKTSFDVQTDHINLLNLVLSRLNPGGTLVFSNNYRKFKLDESAFPGWNFREITGETVPEDFTRKKSIHRCWNCYSRRIKMVKCVLNSGD